MIFKILRSEEWDAFRAAGETSGAPIDIADGYVHFSTAAQVKETASKYFAGVEGLHLLAYEAEALSALKWEPSRGGALFPHLFAPLRLDQMRWHAALPLVAGDLVFPADLDRVDHCVDPERYQFEAFKALPRDQEIQMLNLVRLRAAAAYPEGHPNTGMTGSEAYSVYGHDSGPVFSRVGGEILWRGAQETTLIGPPSEVWDVLFIARYPSAAAFLEMVTDAEYQKAVTHRQAGVETSRLIRCGALPGGTVF